MQAQFRVSNLGHRTMLHECIISNFLKETVLKIHTDYKSSEKSITFHLYSFHLVSYNNHNTLKTVDIV